MFIGADKEFWCSSRVTGLLLFTHQKFRDKLSALRNRKHVPLFYQVKV